jgi:uncharacterized protein YdhG (YjbR/CyaY superfamily)
MSEVDTVFNSYEGKVAEKLAELRAMVHAVGEATPRVGEIQECLKWGQPSFVTVKPASGSTIRIDAIKNKPDHVAMYFICTTSLVDQFRELYPETFEYQGNRALIFKASDPLPQSELRHCIAKALTYKLKS